MSDHILYSSESLAAVSKQLSELADGLSTVQSRVSSMQMSSENGGELDLLPGAVRLTHTKLSAGGTVAAHMQVLAQALSAERGDILKVVQTIKDVQQMFEGAEREIIRRIENTAESEAVTVNPLEQEEQDARIAAVQQLLRDLKSDYDGFEGFINYDELNKITGWVGNLYSALSGNADDLFTLGAHEMALSLLSTLGKGEDNLFIKEFNKASKKFDDGKKLSVNIVEIASDVLDKDELKDFEKFVNDLPLAEDFNVGDLDTLKKSGEAVEHIYTAFKEYQMMTSADPDKLQSVANGLRASGDPQSMAAAAILENMKDPGFCLQYAMATNGCNALMNFGNDKLGDAMKMIPGIGSAAAIVEIGQFASEGLTNASALVNCAKQVQRMDNARQGAYRAAVDAASAYLADPSDGNYQRVMDSKNAFYSTTAQTVDSMKQLAEAQNDSLLGMFNRADTSGFDNLTNTYRDKMNSSALET